MTEPMTVEKADEISARWALKMTTPGGFAQLDRRPLAIVAAELRQQLLDGRIIWVNAGPFKDCLMDGPSLDSYREAFGEP